LERPSPWSPRSFFLAHWRPRGESDVPCPGSRQILDTVGIAVDSRTGHREQTLIEAKMAVVDVMTARQVGVVYVDDEGMRYLQVRGGVAIAGLPLPPRQAARGQKIEPLPLEFTFDAPLHLRACSS
jgi:hypothetical protein